jgi:predicted secreted hydrolase
MSRRALAWLPWMLIAALAALFAAWLNEQRGESKSAHARLDIGSLLSSPDVDGYLRADAPREFRFPTDHGPHEGFRTEWWYFTGNLADGAGRRFGYQLTFFRSALTSKPATRESKLGADHAWMAHFTLGDVEAGRFRSFERFSREASGLAGANSAPPSVFLRDWCMEVDAAGSSFALRARESGAAIELRLVPSKPEVLHGENGLSRKSVEEGNASYYYSLTRMATTGSVEVDGKSFTIEGDSWMDREWMTSALAAEQVGWDWFALQLDDGTELMWYSLRRRDGSIDPFSAGSFIDEQGARRALSPADVKLQFARSWTSPRSQAVYPADWTLSIAELGLELQITPLLADQELDVGFKYWEGAVEVRGSRAGDEVRGRGFVELVGYGDQRPGTSGRGTR